MHADGEGFILLQQLLERNFHFLALVVEANAGRGDLHFLTRIGQNHFIGFWIDYHAIRRRTLQNLVATQIQRFQWQFHRFLWSG